MADKIVVLDGFALNPGDLSWDGLRALGEVVVHERTAAADVVARAQEAAALLTNKTPLRSETLRHLPRLRYVGVLATGYDIVDTQAARDAGVTVTNIPTYGTASVAQFAFGLILEFCHRVQRHADDVASGGWSRNPDWSYHLSPLIELEGKTLGLIGYGRIGRQTAAIARAFGMQVIASDPLLGAEEAIESVELDELLRRADFISLHCPLTPGTRGIINRDRLQKMKPAAVLINTARGPLVVEEDLADALNSGRIGGAALDVLNTEPPAPENPLLRAKNCIVTPHIAWATKEARQRLMDLAVENLRAFQQGRPQCVVNP
jgi:glycerate dehydrogenase